MLYKKNFQRTILIIFFLYISSPLQIISQSLIDPYAEVEEIASGILQPEGPVWKDGLGLLFSDIKDNKIYKWTADKGTEVYLNPSDSTNGLTYDLIGRLIAGQMGLRRIVRFENDGRQTSLADKYDGKKFNSPNDLVVKSDGSIFFTDPDFNIPGGKQNKELAFNGIYRINPAGNLQLLATLTLPNGICFSQDEKKLYVNDSQARRIYVWDVVDDSTITNKKLFFPIPANGYADGMKIDKEGNIYCACSSAIWIISPTGELLGKINLPGNVSASNCTWGEADGETLFITAGSSVYKTRPLITGVEKHGSTPPGEIKIYQNYPNPFNPDTIIEYYISQNSNVVLSLFDTVGREVAILENRYRSVGNYKINFNAKQLTSGIYYYSINGWEFQGNEKISFNKINYCIVIPA